LNALTRGAGRIAPLVYPLGPDGNHRDRFGVDCPCCGQAVRVDLSGGSLTLRCFAGCREEEVAARLDLGRIVTEVSAS
jgi:hypothetical protein